MTRPSVAYHESYPKLSTLEKSLLWPWHQGLDINTCQTWFDFSSR